MPGYVTHYIFGREMYTKITDADLKKAIHDNHAVYALGHLGPDIFFYYLPAYVLHGCNLGDMAHTKKTGQFFAALLESRFVFKNPKDQQTAQAYLAGFLGHYILDSTCHPFIYGRTHYEEHAKNYFSRHAYLETEIDSTLLRLKLHQKRTDFHGENTIRLTFRQKKVVAHMLHYAYQHTYNGLSVSRHTIFLAIFSTKLGFRILYDNTGQKKVLFRFAEKQFLGYPIFSPLIANDALSFCNDPFNLEHKKWTNPWDFSITSEESFFDLYNKAEQIYLNRTNLLSALLKEQIHSKKEIQLTKSFLKQYGSRSFHSGLDTSVSI